MCFAGGATLRELKHCFYLAEQERRGGISPHVSPLTLASDIAGLMQAAKFSLPTVDIDTFTVSNQFQFHLFVLNLKHLFGLNFLLPLFYQDRIPRCFHTYGTLIQHG